LLQERDEFPAIDPEKWGFVGGHLDDGEDYLAGAYRELEEETGLRLTHLGDDDIECHEGRQIVFVEPSRVPELDLTAAARIALPAFLASADYAAMTS
jgi:8-oxo-dGTP pyrophosphatase MutT (NUDIX family)